MSIRLLVYIKIHRSGLLCSKPFHLSGLFNVWSVYSLSLCRVPEWYNLRKNNCQHLIYKAENLLIFSFRISLDLGGAESSSFNKTVLDFTGFAIINVEILQIITFFQGSNGWLVLGIPYSRSFLLCSLFLPSSNIPWPMIPWCPCPQRSIALYSLPTKQHVLLLLDLDLRV